MRVLGGLSLVMALTGCTGDDTDSDTDAPVSDGCPTGLERSRNGALVVSQFTYNGVDRFIGFDPTLTFAGVPALCRSADGTRAIWTFAQGEEAFGWLDVSAPVLGSYAANQITSGYMTVNLFGSVEQAVFDAESWQQGFVNVDSVGSPFEVGVSGATGISPNGDTVSFTLSAGAERF